MFRVTLRNLFARKLRLLLSAFAIVLGVAFVAGSFIFTDTIGKSFDQIFEGSSSDVTVRQADSGHPMDAGYNVDARTISPEVVHDIAALDGVTRADGSVDGMGMFLVDGNGKLVGGQGAPTLSFNYNTAPNTAGDPILDIVEGREPDTGEIMIDPLTAERAGFSIGDTVEMVTPDEQHAKRSATLVGLAEITGGGGLAGATLVFFDTATAQEVFLAGADAYTSIAVTGENISQRALADRIESILPDSLEAVTATEIGDEIDEALEGMLGFLTTFLLVFAAIALLVGTFLIVNTFSILVAQRSKELALLRAMGASRRQVTRSVLIEAFATGFVGSTLGLAAGYGLAAGLRALFANIGLDLSGTSLQIAPRTIIAAYAVGLLVTIGAAYFPARRAAKIPPVAAMRDDIALPESAFHRRVILGIGLIVLAIVCATVGFGGSFGGEVGTLFVGGAVLAALLGVALLSPVLARPVIGSLGALFTTMFRAVGRLATQNSLRNPRRTAATASALMIGLALVTTMAIMGASINKSIAAGVDEQFSSDLLVSNAIGTPFSTKVANDIRALDEVSDVAQQQTVVFELDASPVYASAVDLADMTAIYDLEFTAGDASLEKGQIALMAELAERIGANIGDTVTVKVGAQELRTEVAGVYTETYVVGDAMVPFSFMTEAGLKRLDTGIGVNAAPGVERTTVDDAVTKVTAELPTVTVQNKDEFAEAQRAQIDQMLYLIYALLGLAIIIAVLGIINTLAMSVIERTREVGLLRAVGLTRSQLRRMVRLESIAIATLGGVLGIAMGLVFGVVLQRSLREDGITHLAVPATSLVVFAVVALIVGVLAAVVPARRAAKLNVLAAIATE